ncbi:MAG: Ger(x)C family spore germination protein [Oscillospiraceae bacterium]|nr:Ger(x)C family spore germination protein [Oscillospiraceae bacterium]
MKTPIIHTLASHRTSQAPNSKELARRAALLILCVIVILNLCSCWSRRELNTLAIVLATALDTGERADTIQLTAQIVKPGEIKSNSSSSDDQAQKAYANIENSGESVISALNNFSHITNRSMYFSHNRVLIFSSELAKNDVVAGLDAFTRNFETRMNVYILISKGRASEILNEAVELEKIPANHLAELLEKQRTNSETVIVTLRDFSIAMLSDSKAPVAAMVEMYLANGRKKARLEGTAVFKQGKMVGELDVTQTRGLLWATGDTKKSTITLDVFGGKVDVLIAHSNGSMKPTKGEDGSIRMKLKIDADGSVESNETGEDLSSVDSIEMLTVKAQESIRADIENAIKQARYLSADVFGFGEAIRGDFPKDWEKIKKNWDKEFSKLEYDIEIDIKIDRTGGLSKPIVPGGAQ